MSLPPGFLDELRNRISLSQVVGRKVIWDSRKSNQGKGDMWAPCPFHQEKTASFHVDDRKGFYYCFGCHEKGDAISFVRGTENVGFMEAIEILAREAGLPMPARDPKAQEKADRRSQLADVMEQAVQYFRLQLKTGAATAARDYLAGRGLSDQTQDRFDIGFAPDARQGLYQHLTGKGVSPELVIEAGLCAKPEDGGAPYDRFRGRIIFPIRDARGRAIALGGRAMMAEARAKYLNSPETPLFDKGRSLYNQGPAREAGKNQPLIVAEGYMDVIALVEAGFEATVAPLGTAITEDQLRLLWRISPEPVLALDGDKAGLRAAMRVIDLALPLLEAGNSLRFALMPQGQDPDDLIRSGGSDAMQTCLEAAVPMVDLLWRRETEGKSFDSPERKAALDKALREKLRLIRDPSIRRHYGDAVKDMRWQLFRPQRSGTGWSKQGRFAAPVPLASTKSSVLASAGNRSETGAREQVILAVCLNWPDIISDFETGLEAMECHDTELAFLRSLVLRHQGDEDIRSKIGTEIDPQVLEKLFNAAHVAITPAIRNSGDMNLARLTVAEELAKLEARRGLSLEIADAARDLDGVADEGVTWRLTQAAEAKNKADRSQTEDNADFEVGPNGALVDRDEKSAFSELLEGISFTKERRR